jgi:hypothetical protein
MSNFIEVFLNVNIKKTYVYLAIYVSYIMRSNLLIQTCNTNSTVSLTILNGGDRDEVVIVNINFVQFLLYKK